MGSFDRMMTKIFNDEFDTQYPDAKIERYSQLAIDADSISNMLNLNSSLRKCIEEIIFYCTANELKISDWTDLRSICNYLINHEIVSPSIKKGLEKIKLKISVAEYYGLYLIPNYSGPGLKSITDVCK